MIGSIILYIHITYNDPFSSVRYNLVDIRNYLRFWNAGFLNRRSSRLEKFVYLFHLLPGYLQDPDVHGGHDDQRGEVGEEWNQDGVDLVQTEDANIGLAGILDRSGFGVPAEVDGKECHGNGECPDSGADLPHDRRTHESLVPERRRDGEVTVETDGEEGKDGNGTECDVSGNVDVAEGRAERPPDVQSVDGAERKDDASEQQVGNREGQDEVVGCVAHLAISYNSQADEQIAEYCHDDYDADDGCYDDGPKYRSDVIFI